jgi:hypothetical protein
MGDVPLFRMSTQDATSQGSQLQFQQLHSRQLLSDVENNALISVVIAWILNEALIQTMEKTAGIFGSVNFG